METFDVNFGGVRQRLILIPPGQFQMGSPEDEPERRADEIRHAVTLTRGFWMADTACTQALWTALMKGKNPSRFQEGDLPVENVSWDDCQHFLKRLNSVISVRPDEGVFRLPTEAEWEYACRAGTETPFSFGENITVDQVNYDGSYPYAEGPKGTYRARTVTVKEPGIPCNEWVIYQMHGNVWEWCRDWYGPYSEGPTTDPTGPETGRLHVLRGGSWYDDARFCRSAFRGDGASAPCENGGFRFVLA